MYMVAPTWIDFTNIQEYSDGEDECVIAVKQGDGGCVKNVVELGKTYQYIIVPVDGWSINSVSFNGADVTNLLSDGRYTTPVITGSSELNVVFKQGGSGVKDIVNSSVKVLASNGSVTISGNDMNENVAVYSVNGVEMASDSGNCTIQLESGVYIIKVGKEVFKVSI